MNRTGVEPHPALVQAVLKHFDCSPKLLHTLFLWAESKAGFKSSATLFNSMVNVLAKAKEFGSAWSMVHDKVSGHDGPDSISKDTFAILIRRYVQAGMKDILWLKDLNITYYSNLEFCMLSVIRLLRFYLNIL